MHALTRCVVDVADKGPVMHVPSLGPIASQSASSDAQPVPGVGSCERWNKSRVVRAQ
jgi:hypothetical protein